jgi:hypothetical protein
MLEPIIESIRKGTNLPRQEILQYLADWEVVPVQLAGQHVGTAVMKGTEIHFALVPGWRPKSCRRGAIKAFLEPLIDRRGFLTTRVPHHRLSQKRFVERVGFKPTWKDGNFEYYLLGSVPFERKKK